MTAHLNRRGPDEVAGYQDGEELIKTELEFTPAAYRMFELLMTSFRRPVNGVMSSVFIKDVLAAASLSESTTVKQIFHSVHLSMEKVHEQLGISQRATP